MFQHYTNDILTRNCALFQFCVNMNGLSISLVVDMSDWLTVPVKYEMFES